MRRFLPLIWFLGIASWSIAQDISVERADEVIVDILSQLADGNEEETDFSAYYDDLYELMQTPLDLNRATREQLEKLLFLSDIQIENILYYLYQYGNMNTIYELRLIEGMDEETIRRLLPFVVVGEAQNGTTDKLYVREIGKYGKHDVYARFGGNVERADGYRPQNGENRKYAGSPLHHLLKYQFHYKDRIWFGLTAEKDAGERFLLNKKGYDFFSAYAQVNRLGIFKTVVLGNFRAAFGEGLVLNTGFRLGKSAEVLNMNRSYGGLRKSSSADEHQFFRGTGATVALGAFELTAFYSNKKVDGDTAGGVFPGFSKTGLHRTELEIKKRHAVRQQVAGGNVTFTHRHLQVGITAVHTLLDHTLQPVPTLYNAGYFRGNRQTTAGVHYRLRLGRLNFFGETALTHDWAAATVNGFSFMPASRVGLVVQHRYLSPRYDSFYANTFAQTSSRSMNEHGVYVGAEVHPFRRWKVSAYADVCRSPWLKYGVPSPSAGTDYLLNIAFAPQRDWDMYWRINCKLRQAGLTDTSRPTEELAVYDRLQFRYVLNRVYGNFRFQTLLYGNMARRADAAWTYGVSAVQDVSYTFSKIPLRVDFRYQFFDAKEYDNRIYCYERDVLHAFSIPMNYGLGSRCYLNVKYNVCEQLSLWLKIAQTVYADGREEMGSGADRIPGNRRTTVRAMLRWSF